MLKNSDLFVIIKHVENDSPSLRIYLQKTKKTNKSMQKQATKEHKNQDNSNR
jgi:hypothetical protein